MANPNAFRCVLIIVASIVAIVASGFLLAFLIPLVVPDYYIPEFEVDKFSISISNFSNSSLANSNVSGTLHLHFNVHNHHRHVPVTYDLVNVRLYSLNYLILNQTLPQQAEHWRTLPPIEISGSMLNTWIDKVFKYAALNNQGMVFSPILTFGVRYEHAPSFIRKKIKHLVVDCGVLLVDNFQSNETLLEAKMGYGSQQCNWDYLSS